MSEVLPVQFAVQNCTTTERCQAQNKTTPVRFDGAFPTHVASCNTSNGDPIAHTRQAVCLLIELQHHIESYFVTPYVQKRAIELPPAFIIVAQLSFGILFGAIGVF